MESTARSPEAPTEFGPIPVVLAVDVEPDGKPAGRDDRVYLDGLATTISWLDGLRPRLEAATRRPANFAWFLRMDPQIETLMGRAAGVADLAAPQMDRLRQMGDGLGLHTHAGRWDATRHRWIVDHGDPIWIEHCLRTPSMPIRANTASSAGSIGLATGGPAPRRSTSWRSWERPWICRLSPANAGRDGSTCRPRRPGRYPRMAASGRFLKRIAIAAFGSCRSPPPIPGRRCHLSGAWHGAFDSSGSRCTDH